ncbi:Ankyrin repeat-containing domain protein [Madurella fahalii]|uniref:Ankyrin repeat-containing domain protein n=1 Tax=Madurella fahalii TaxID=1157608 RepID=A0ABQ0FWK5_9PEZI
MHLLGLPLEVLDMIVHYGIISRGFPRALRLSLVCKPFYASVGRTLFHTKVLDDREWRGAFSRWNVRKHHGADKLWHDYLVFRSRDKGDDSVACYVEIRKVVDALVQHCQDDCQNDDAPDWDQVLDRLCWLPLECDSYRDCGWNVGRTEPAKLGLRILSAATYLGYTSLVRDLLDQGYDPTESDDLFPSPMYIAARTGQADMLHVLQEHLPDFEEHNPNSYTYFWRSKIGPKSLHGAATRGDMDMVRLCLYPPSRIIPEGEAEDKEAETSILGQKPGSIPFDSFLGRYIESAIRRARSAEVYEYLQSLVDETNRDPMVIMKNEHLWTMAEAGDMAMVRYLLSIGADVSHKVSFSRTPLARAVRACNEDIVDLLLERGADPNGCGGFPGTALTAAVKAGSMVMVRKLLDAGANIHYPNADSYTLRHAVKLEHTAMVELLLDLGIRSEIGKACALWTANNMGLESMADLLRSTGASLAPWIHPLTALVSPRPSSSKQPEEKGKKLQQGAPTPQLLADQKQLLYRLRY